MLPTQLFTSVQQLSLNQKPLVTGVQDVRPVDTQFEIGQRTQGRIQAQINPGVFKVQVANQTLHMPLPGKLGAGDLVELEVLTLQPKLTFGLVASNNPISTSEQLSTAARLFSSMTQQQAEHAVVRAPQGQSLWLDNQLPDVKTLAQNLQHAISHSGLFYESHQVQWLEGGRSTTQLLQEPQNQPQTTTHPSPATTHLLPPNTPSHVQALVQQQLNALDSGQIVWQGTAWPGQDMEWEIHEEPQHPPRADELRQWVTQIHLNLSTLGEVSAAIRLGPDGLSLHIEADSEQTSLLLQNASGSLIDALVNRGLSVLNTQVTTHHVDRG